MLLLRLHRTHLLLALWVASVVGGFVVSCGGTTGQEGLPLETLDAGSDSLSLDGGASVTSSTDATLGFDGQVVDASDIVYADADRLPHFEGGADDASASTEGGGDPGAGPWDQWPACGCDTTASLSAPLVVDQSGTCGAYVWTTNAACDALIRNSNIDLQPAQTSPFFPPCCDLRDAGAATSGPGLGTSLFRLCAAAYSCIFLDGNLHSEAGIPNAIDTYCGPGNTKCQPATGPCKDVIEAAFQSTDSNEVQSNIVNVAPAYKGRAGAEALGLAQNVIGFGGYATCFAPDGGK